MMANYDYDLAVIGGGSGGMAAAKAARDLGANVILFDFVTPSTHGSRWGPGGTCVNVGCVPKKLCHYTGLIGAAFHDARHFGWKIPEKVEHDWEKLIESINMHTNQLSWGYKKSLHGADCPLLNESGRCLKTKSCVTFARRLVSFKDAHTLVDNKGKEYSADKILIAVGGRPWVPDFEGNNLAITSDDIFKLQKNPGKTLVVGGGYIGVECAGFMNELGVDVTLSIRSVALRPFDRQVSDKIIDNMKRGGVNVSYGWSPSKIEKVDGRLSVTFAHKSNGKVKTEVYDTVLYATGRKPNTKNLGVEKAGIKVDRKGKIPTVNEQTNVENIYAVGDVISEGLELTPVAITAATLLVRRLFGNSKQLMSYRNVPTTVFSSFEYGSVGYNEQDAVKEFGEEDIEIYLFSFENLEISATHRSTHFHPDLDVKQEDEDFGPMCLTKLVCQKSKDDKVIGFHYVGPNAGEVTQGFSLAVKLGAKKADFDSLVGIHPTDAESFTDLKITKRSGEDFVAKGGCGGGSC